MPRFAARLLVPATLALVLLTGCSAGPGDGDHGGGAADPAAPAEPEGTERQVVYQGELALTAPDVPATARDAIAAVTAVDGFVAGDEREQEVDGATATLELRIPADAFTSTVETLAGLGTEVSRRLSTTDVTETAADLDTRIASKLASVERVRDLMADAASLSEVVSIESELTTRETELAELQADKRRMDDAVAYATLALHLTSSDLPEPPAERASPPGFGRGLASGWDGLVIAVSVALTVLGFLLPFLLAAGVPAGAAWTWSRRRRGLPVWGRKVRAGGSPPGEVRSGETPADAPDRRLRG